MTPYTHSDWLALHAAIRASPKDDLPRLVAADWLDEHGEHDRAAFIRLQIELATPDPCGNPATCGYGPTPPAVLAEELVLTGEIELHFCGRAACLHRAGLRRRERSLWDDFTPTGVCAHPWFDLPGSTPTVMRHEHHGCEIRTTVGSEADYDHGRASFSVRRGFVDEVRCRLEDWIGRWEVTDVTSLDELVRRFQKTLYTPGIGPLAVAAHPVQRVVVTDRRADTLNFRRITGIEYRWWESGRGPEGPHTAAELPTDVFEILWETPGVVRQQAGATRCVGYASPGLADDALSVALVTWAKQQSEGGQ